MATQSAYVFSGPPIVIIGGTQANASNFAQQHVNTLLLHVEIDSGSTLTGINAYCRSDMSGTMTTYSKTAL